VLDVADPRVVMFGCIAVIVESRMMATKITVRWPTIYDTSPY